MMIDYHELEKQILVSCRETEGRHAALVLIGCFRQYREATKTLLARRYRDGACDGAAVSTFAGTLEWIDEGEQ